MNKGFFSRSVVTLFSTTALALTMAFSGCTPDSLTGPDATLTDSALRADVAANPATPVVHLSGAHGGRGDDHNLAGAHGGRGDDHNRAGAHGGRGDDHNRAGVKGGRGDDHNRAGVKGGRGDDHN